MSVHQFVCNKFGLAEFFALHYADLNLPKPELVLDVGSGVGPLSIFLADMQGVRVTAVEINPVAHICCLKNIVDNRLKGKITPLNMNFTDWVTDNCSARYDLIVANPPVFQPEQARIMPQYSKKYLPSEIDVELFSFLTNYWHDENGLDLVDHIFGFANLALRPNGHVAIVCCEAECRAGSIITAKAKKHDLCLKTGVSGVITAESIGVESFIHGVVDCHVLAFKRNSAHAD